MTISNLWKGTAAAVAAALAVLATAAGAGAATCVGDCNNDTVVLINEIVNSVNIFLESVAVTSCPNADQNGDGHVLINEVVGAVNSFLDPATCPMVSGGATPTPTGPVATSTPTQSATRTLTATPSPTPTLGLAVCGNGNAETLAGEDCDDGGTCIGGDNAGDPCTAESQCLGQGVCLDGVKIESVCDRDADCAPSKCIHCKPLGGDGCAANCTSETIVPTALKSGKTTKLCLGGTNDGQPCTKTSDCPGSQGCQTLIMPGTSGAVVQTTAFPIALALNGTQTLVFGRLRDGRITGVTKADTVKFPAIPVAALACACVRGVAGKSCGGTVFEKDGSLSVDCSLDATVCNGKKPCTFVHGPNNSSTILVGCNGLSGIDLLFTQDENHAPLPYPTPPTPPPGSKDPVITLSNSGGAGSAIFINSSAIGTVTGFCTGTTPAYGPDGKLCNVVNGVDDDPPVSRGLPQTLPQVTGKATAMITNSVTTGSGDIGPYSYTGTPYDCAGLSSNPPQLSGAIAGAFTGLNQPATGDIVVRNIFVGGGP